MVISWSNVLKNVSVAVVFGCILLFFFYRLTYFNFFVFDELYYAQAAQEFYRSEGDSNFQHPPLGKWLISLPFYVLGDSWSFSWRIAPLVFGYLGLVVMYFFARKLELNWWQSLITVLALVGTSSWYVLSRTAMLDIFLAFFVLLAAYIFYLYLHKNNFSRNYDEYSNLRYLLLSGVVTGLAGLSKWSGFFLFLFYLFVFLYYLTGDVRKRIFHFLFIVLISVYTYFFVALVIYNFNFTDVAFRTFQSAIFHNSAMLPESNPAHVKKYNLAGGAEAFLRYFSQSEVYIVSASYLPKYGLVNNQMLAGAYVGFTLLFLLSIIGMLVRKIQKLPVEIPVFVKDKQMLFTYFYAFVMLFPWLVVPRVQYTFYYVPAFPFIILMVCYYLFKYCDWKLNVLFFVCYFVFFLYWLPISIPI